MLQKKLLLDSIKLHDPEIEVMQWRKDTTSRIAKDELSITQEMGKLYNSMLDVLDGMGIRRIIINNAKLSLLNKMKTGVEPVTISKINFSLLRTATDVKKRDEFVKNEQSVELETTDQNIALPGGRHRLAFKKFKLELFSKRIQLDSCTLTAFATDSSKSSYNIFFEKLLLKGVDFEAMYRRNLIRADSVYCVSPLFDININPSDVAKKTARPDPEKIIQELTGDLDLAFVGVKDAGIHIDISGKKNRSLFNSNKDNFEMRGLRISEDSSKPVVVERFDMLVRDYHLYNEDSSVAYTFDSIRFVNNKIVLNNFSVQTEPGKISQHNERDFRIPYFELTGLDWNELIFEENLKAREAVLYNPIINYVKRKTSGLQKKTNLFASLQSLDELVTLNRINIINGQINMKLGPSTSFSLKNANLNLYSNMILESTNNEGLRRAVDYFSFSRGLIKIKDITAQLYNVRYTGSNLIHADRLSVTSSANKVKAEVSDVFIDDMLLDDKAENVVVDGIRWRKANVSLKSSAGTKAKTSNAGSFNIKNIAGKNTQLSFSNGKADINTFIQSLSISSITKNGEEAPKVQGLLLAGNNLSVNNGPLKAKADAYNISSNSSSFLSGLKMQRIENRDSLNVQSPRINFFPDVNAILAKDIHFTNVQAQSPVIKYNKWSTEAPQGTNGDKASIRIDNISANEPFIFISTHRNDSVTIINIPRSDNSLIKASDLVINAEGLQVGSFTANTTAATFVKPSGEILGVEKGLVDVELSNIRLAKKDGKPFWSALINTLNLKDPNTLTLGKNQNKLVFNQVAIGNFNLSSDYISDFNTLLKFNVSAWLRTTTGQYVDSVTTLKWYNADYNYSKKTLTLDSFAYHPTQERDVVIANTPHQTDYMTFKTGAVKFTDFNLEKYEKDSAIIANAITLTNPLITIYRDKFPPFLAGKIKQLPVDKIKNIKVPVSIQNINIVDGSLGYTEKNAKTRAEGTVLLAHMNAKIANIKNRNISQADSLQIALDAYLMDSALIRLRVKESYTDSLSGFLMTLRLQPTSLSFLNPVLAPLSNIIITSGAIDSLHLRAVGREYLALGEMKMYYKNLKIKLIKDGNEENTTFVTKAISFLANAFIIKKNNNGRTGLVYFERLRDRSFFNYIVKMTFSGMATSVGAKKNRKYLKQYRRELKEQKLPPIDFE